MRRPDLTYRQWRFVSAVVLWQMMLDCGEDEDALQFKLDAREALADLREGELGELVAALVRANADSTKDAIRHQCRTVAQWELFKPGGANG